MKREVGNDASSNYASGRPTEAPFSMENNLPLEYEPEIKARKSNSLFNRIISVEQRYRQPKRPEAPKTDHRPTSSDLVIGGKFEELLILIY